MSIEEIKKRYNHLLSLSNRWCNDQCPPATTLTDEFVKQITHFETYDPSKDYINLFKQAKSIWERQDVIRKYYLEYELQILALAETNLRKSYNIYAFEWLNIFTPIEMDAWQCIRCSGIILYPQYPALNYMLDFGNPYLKIALELDGKEYHNAVKDRVRDQRLYDELSWKVFRVTGSEANRLMDMPNRYPDNYDSDAQNKLNQFMYNTVDGVIEAIKQVYFNPNKTDDIEDLRFYDLCISTLHYHRLANFPIS